MSVSAPKETPKQTMFLSSVLRCSTEWIRFGCFASILFSLVHFLQKRLGLLLVHER